MWRVWSQNTPPHYHILFFGVSSLELRPFFTSWEKERGFVLLKDVTYYEDDIFKTSKYVSKYCSKGVFDNPKVHSTAIEKPFRLVSKSLGLSYVDDLKKYHLPAQPGNNYQSLLDILDKRFVVIKNQAYGMPRYYREKIFGQGSLLSNRLSLAMVTRNDDLFNRQCAALQAENPGWSYDQAAFAILCENDSAQIFKSNKSYQQIGDFLNKSKL